MLVTRVQRDCIARATYGSNRSHNARARSATASIVARMTSAELLLVRAPETTNEASPAIQGLLLMLLRVDRRCCCVRRKQALRAVCIDIFRSLNTHHRRLHAPISKSPAPKRTAISRAALARSKWQHNQPMRSGQHGGDLHA